MRRTKINKKLAPYIKQRQNNITKSKNLCQFMTSYLTCEFRMDLKPSVGDNREKDLFHFTSYLLPDIGRELNVHDTFRRPSGCLLKVICTFKLHMLINLLET